MEDFGPWVHIPCVPPFSHAGLRETIDGGQMFRWQAVDVSCWQGIWDRFAARVRIAEGGAIEAAFPDGTAEEALPALLRLLGLDQDYVGAYDSLPWRSDRVLRSAMMQFGGLRVVNQPLGEALLGFICSSTKRIPQIKECMGLLAERFGSPVAGGQALPTWPQLAAVDEADLRGCKLGYRARYVWQTAQFLAGDPGYLTAVEAMPYEGAHAALTRLPGVGAKVADCVLLYGTRSLQPFPVDTWIIQAMAHLYGLHGWPVDHVAQFGRTHFGEFSGLAQQFLFAYARRAGGA